MAEETVLKAKKTAILVIHGIGEQNPYETLDNFGRHVADYLRRACGSNLQLIPAKIDHDDWVEARVRLQMQNCARDPGSNGLVDIYEYYWAPYTEDKIPYRESLNWLIKTDLTPIRHLEDNLIALQDDQSGMMKPSQIFWREIRRIFWFYIPTLVLLLVLASWIPDVSKIPAWLSQDVSTIFKSPTLTQGIFKVLMIISFVTGALLLFFGARGILLKHRPNSPRFKWEWRTFGCGLATIAGGVGIGLADGIDFARFFHPFVTPGTLKFAVAYLVGWGLSYFLKNYVGDVAVYVNADAKSKNYAARTAVLQGATTALTRILRDEREAYDQVILAGHSLGSVIAYDAVNELLNKATGAPDQLVGKKAESDITLEQLEKLRGLITFGSPLDKVYYFFRDYTDPDQLIRAQILSYLHSFRKQPSGRKYDPYTFQRYEADLLTGLRWLNAWAKLDPVSGPLHFYRVDETREFKYKTPVLAHLSYWGDPSFYQFFGDQLLVTRVPYRAAGVGAP